MEITEVKVFPIQEEKLKAFVSIVFDHCFMVNDIKIIQGKDGLFISMPSRKKKNGEFKDVAHPLNNETRHMIEAKVLGEYERVLGERGERLPAPPHPRAAVASVVPAAAPAPLNNSDGGSHPQVAHPMGAHAATESVVTPAAQERLAAAGVDGADRGSPGDGHASVPTDSAAAEPAPATAEKSLDEIEELHLRDSFWTVT